MGCIADQESPSSAAFGGIRYARVDLERLVVLHILAARIRMRAKPKARTVVSQMARMSEGERMSVCMIL